MYKRSLYVLSPHIVHKLLFVYTPNSRSLYTQHVCYWWHDIVAHGQRWSRTTALLQEGDIITLNEGVIQMIPKSQFLFDSLILPPQKKNLYGFTIDKQKAVPETQEPHEWRCKEADRSRIGWIIACFERCFLLPVHGGPREEERSEWSTEERRSWQVCTYWNVLLSHTCVRGGGGLIPLADLHVIDSWKNYFGCGPQEPRGRHGEPWSGWTNGSGS